MAGAYSRETFDQDKHRYDTEKAQMAAVNAQIGTTQLENRQYSRVLTDYLRCANTFVGQFVYPVVLEQQLQRSDLDTVCAYELYQMKKQFV